MGSEESINLQGRLKSLLLQLQTESGILDRIVYKNKNQHRRCPYFQSLSKVRRDVRLLQSSGLGQVLTVLFPIFDGKKPARNAYLPMGSKKKSPTGNHNYRDRLLGVARLLSQMTEPVLKAAIQISFLLAKSFFTGFSLTVLAILARLRVLVQQILLDVVSVFNKVSSLPQNKLSLKPTRAGIEAFREYYPSNEDVLTLECVWEKDKFVLVERKHKSSDRKKQDLDPGALPSATSIQYESIDLFNKAGSSEHESSQQIKGIEDGKKLIPIEPAISSSPTQSEDPVVGLNITEQNSIASSFEGTSRNKKVAFVAVGKPKPLRANSAVPSKKMKLDLLAADSVKADDPFLNLLLRGSRDSTF